MPTTYTFTTNTGDAVSIPVYTPDDITTYASYSQVDSMPRHPWPDDIDNFIDAMYSAWSQWRKNSKELAKYKSKVESFKSILNSKRSIVEKLILCKMAIEWEPVFDYLYSNNKKIPEDKFKDYLNSDVKLDEH